MNTHHFRHSVEVYQDDQVFINSLINYFKEGLEKNETCIVIATKEHRQALYNGLKSAGINMDLAEMTGQFLALDAANTLSHFMENGMPSTAAFNQVIGSLLPHIPVRKIRAYGEMVALLWEQGNIAAALKLETLWNDIGKIRNFTLHCAYPEKVTSGSGEENIREMFHLHN
jgi:hypothetical protein